MDNAADNLIKKYNFTLTAQANKINEIINELLKVVNNTDHSIPDIEFRLEIAAREILANAIEYGCKDHNDEIEILFSIEQNKIVLSVIDPGEGFNWQERSFEIVPVLDERGRGLKMINKVSDEMDFNDKGNQIKITFLGGK
ncbi:ATP-binding protein [Halanaerobiaceae bacterium Z-7014]|uniref:ATP-binding protein n=1 Tax=Halonatronomonas betaini TaxID=2778430 RepID=A0A931AYW5_9FIRM|nr:ATP-binding protein [Halonatronomonas betaini]MBF8437333.1 ATP-binding protein [Halonatronomonas betaini]